MPSWFDSFFVGDNDQFSIPPKFDDNSSTIGDYIVGAKDKVIAIGDKIDNAEAKTISFFRFVIKYHKPIIFLYIATKIKYLLK